MTAVMAKVRLVIVNVCVPSPATQPFSSREMVFDTIVNTLSRYNVGHPEPLSWARSGDLSLAEQLHRRARATGDQRGPCRGQAESVAETDTEVKAMTVLSL